MLRLLLLGFGFQNFLELRLGVHTLFIKDPDTTVPRACPLHATQYAWAYGAACSDSKV